LHSSRKLSNEQRAAELAAMEGFARTIGVLRCPRIVEDDLERRPGRQRRWVLSRYYRPPFDAPRVRDE
jgi:hypothetical protein